MIIARIYIWSKNRNITDISSDYFYELALSFKQYIKISLGNCFKYCSMLTKILFHPDFETSNVNDACYILWMNSLTSLDLSALTTGNITDMKSMFCRCKMLIL